MQGYPSEPELLAALDRGDELIRLCAAGELPFQAFVLAYDNLYWSYALDGHESDSAGAALLVKYAARIEPHRVVAESILSKVCTDADAAQDGFRAAGRFGSKEATARLATIAAEWVPK
ncbi:hypothetical protein [Pseudoxanthomonas indica]|uniref:Uncharacterized protein n=1 Tax=Pseudoxanthomonas indica TaxID=428993 RepID=A0A1T5LYQ3_9GAMM|nr:hypothetical protein [Pseudoxanthomonas indica]GGD41886.1 hypothetical protein GCM10007235_12430 [Pseudoxanthomonas indica]SKC80698.1 hypothetical protein SAMN06296058_3371 [Pseudoxanthomonas indica]